MLQQTTSNPDRQRLYCLCLQIGQWLHSSMQYEAYIFVSICFVFFFVRNKIINLSCLLYTILSVTSTVIQLHIYHSGVDSHEILILCFIKRKCFHNQNLAIEIRFCSTILSLSCYIASQTMNFGMLRCSSEYSLR